MNKKDLVADSPAHAYALDNKQEVLNKWNYNVADHFKGMSVEEINSVLRKTANPFAVLFEQVIGDFNMSTGIRNANAFNAIEVFYLGSKKYDKRGAVGCWNYTPIYFIDNKDQLLSLKEKYYFIGVDNVPGSISINDAVLPKNSLFIFGEEGCGITPTLLKMCDIVINIPQFGSVRSLNVGVASGIVMYEFIRRNTLNNQELAG